MWQRPTVAAWREPNLLPHRQQARRRLQRHGAVVWLTSMALWLAGVAIAGVWVEHERDATLATYQDWQRRWQARQGAPEASGATAHVPTPAAVGETATAVSFRKANLRLEVTPTLTPEGNIMLEVSISNDSRGVDTAQGMTINTRRVKSKVLVRDGGTVVIGGILEKTDDRTGAKVPVLGDVPLLGRLFRSQTERRQQAEMLVFITPRLINADGQPS